MMSGMKLAFLVLLGACGADRPTPPSRPPDPAPRPAATPVASHHADELDARFVDAIRAAQPAYAKWGRVDERPRAAPTDCEMVSAHPEGVASHVRISDASDSPHDKKLYFLWATDRYGYLAESTHDRPLPTGFTIVKESFHAEPSTTAANPAPEGGNFARAPRPIRTLSVGGKTLQTGAPEGLYVMKKIGGADAAGTDDGWIYGTITTDGAVTSAGRVASCMGCHASATHERLFGLKPL
jgi:hypothetical protein